MALCYAQEHTYRQLETKEKNDRHTERYTVTTTKAGYAVTHAVRWRLRSRSAHVEFVVGKVVLAQIFSRYIGFP
jgi:hypothetical protein